MYKYHYIGPINHSTNIGFYVGDKLVCCCCFSPVTRKETAIRLNIDTKILENYQDLQYIQNTKRTILPAGQFLNQ